MSEALQAVIHYGFSTLHLNRMEALIDPTNWSSIRIVEKNGFQKEGVLRGHYKRGEEFEDSVLYALVRLDYGG